MGAESNTNIDSALIIQAFCSVIGAGAATCIGSAVVFSPHLVNLAKNKNIAAALAFAAGIMIYLSMVEIFAKSIAGFEDNGHSHDNSFIYTTLTFFAGAILMKCLDMIIQILVNVDHDDRKERLQCALPNKYKEDRASARSSGREIVIFEEETPVNDIILTSQIKDKRHPDGLNQHHTEGSTHDFEDTEELDSNPEEQRELFVIGAATAIAITIHNFPEGLATFVTYIDDPAAGIALAVGIATHNIPEGICVSIPIYYATGNRWKAFLWGSLSGFSELFSAFIAWMLLASFSSWGNTFGILFGLIGGIMAFISIDELIPTAVRYDFEGTCVTPCIFSGMFLIALSLMLFSA